MVSRVTTHLTLTLELDDQVFSFLQNEVRWRLVIRDGTGNPYEVQYVQDRQCFDEGCPPPEDVVEMLGRKLGVHYAALMTRAIKDQYIEDRLCP